MTFQLVGGAGLLFQLATARNASSRFREKEAGRGARDVRLKLWGVRRSGVAPEWPGSKLAAMKKLVELNDETYAALQRLAAAKNLSPAEVIAAMVNDGR